MQKKSAILKSLLNLKLKKIIFNIFLYFSEYFDESSASGLKNSKKMELWAILQPSCCLNNFFPEYKISKIAAYDESLQGNLKLFHIQENTPFGVIYAGSIFIYLKKDWVMFERERIFV